MRAANCPQPRPSLQSPPEHSRCRTPGSGLGLCGGQGLADFLARLRIWLHFLQQAQTTKTAREPLGAQYSAGGTIRCNPQTTGQWGALQGALTGDGVGSLVLSPVAALAPYPAPASLSPSPPLRPTRSRDPPAPKALFLLGRGSCGYREWPSSGESHLVDPKYSRAEVSMSSICTVWSPRECCPPRSPCPKPTADLACAGCWSAPHPH